MGDVVALPKKDDERLIWVCNCGCTTFRLFSDGHAECASCEGAASGEPEGWRARLPQTPAIPETVEADAFAVKSMDDADVFLKRHARFSNDIATAVLLHSDATISTWQRGDASRDWIIAQLDHAKTRLIGD